MMVRRSNCWIQAEWSHAIWRRAIHVGVCSGPMGEREGIFETALYQPRWLFNLYGAKRASRSKPVIS